MHRRLAASTFTTLLAGLALRARAQGSGGRRAFRIGLLPDLKQGGGALRRVLAEALAERGLAQGRDVQFVDSDAAFADPIAPAARRLVDAKPDVAVVASSAHALAVFQLDPKLPIVMWTGADPVPLGMAHSLARPGKSVTGVSHYVGWEVWGKLMELLREAQPGLRRLDVLWGYAPPQFPAAMIEDGLRNVAQAAARLGLSVQVTPVAAPERLAEALASIEARRPQALLLASGPGYFARREQVLRFAVAQRVPTIADSHWPATDALQPLLAYAPLPDVQLRQAARFVARILEGEAPGDLPVELPERLLLALDQRMARAIGLPVPRVLLLRAERVFE